jgi:unsaturated chondroitin disaccharide hydrolase
MAGAGRRGQSLSFPVLSAALPLIPPDGLEVPGDLAGAADRAWQTAATKVRALVERLPDCFPLYTEDGRWAVNGDAWTSWCEGFLAGQLWLLASRTADPFFRNRAEHYSRLIEPRKEDRFVHDLGFLFWPSWRRWYEETGDEAKDAVVVEAGKTLALRFNERGRFLRSFLAADSLFIDIMMNVGIIFHAAARTGDSELARIAYEHCLTTRRVLIRGDGSASHEGIFDLETGTFTRQSSQQGWRNDGSWARGQSWALYGFGTAWRYTGDRRFLATAVQCADFYVERTGDRLVPPNDWEEPNPTQRWESSAAAIAAGGIWQLACIVPGAVRARHYAEYAIRVLHRLLQDDFLAANDAAWEGILKHGTYHEEKGLGVDESVMWGDYFLLAALDAIAGSVAEPRGSHTEAVSRA